MCVKCRWHTYRNQVKSAYLVETQEKGWCAWIVCACEADVGGPGCIVCCVHGKEMAGVWKADEINRDGVCIEKKVVSTKKADGVFMGNIGPVHQSWMGHT